MKRFFLLAAATVVLVILPKLANAGVVQPYLADWCVNVDGNITTACNGAPRWYPAARKDGPASAETSWKRPFTFRKTLHGKPLGRPISVSRMPQSWYRFGLLMYRNGYYDAGAGYLDSALRLGLEAPAKKRAEIARAISLAEAGRAAEAEPALRRLLENSANAGNLDLRLSLLRIEYESGRYRDALAESDRAMATDPGNAALHFWRARIFQQQGLTGPAAAEAERSRDLAPDSPAPHNLLVRLYLKPGPAARSSACAASRQTGSSTSPNRSGHLATIESVPAPFRSYVLVSREQIARNFRNVRSVVGPAVEVAGVVKADAYGHGAQEVARVLVAEGARWLAVSSVDEGVNLRCGGIGQTRILVMGGFLPFESDALVEYDLTPAVHSLEQMRQVEELARSSGKPLRYHLKIDSGMGRLGTRAAAAEILAVLEQATYSRLEGLMTHFASAADYSTDQTAAQLACFHTVAADLAKGGVRPQHLHTSSTSAIGYGRSEGWHDMVRAGHALYGYVSPARGDAPAQRLDVKPVLTWKARLLAVKDIPEGALVGYGGTFKAPRPMRIGILGAGYADGIFHRLSNRGKVIADGKLTPILGTISMDLTTIDLSHTAALGPGDAVTLLGQEGEARLDAQQIARVAGTISYNILCSISARVRRVYV